jgi:hypothetical protein
MSTKRKASMDKATLPKKAKHWFAEGLDELSSIFNLKSYASLGMSHPFLVFIGKYDYRQKEGPND